MELDWASQELKYATALEARVRGSIADVCAALAAAPGVSFTAAAGERGRQAVTRLGSVVSRTSEPPAAEAGAAPAWSPSPEPARLLAGHVVQTAARCSAYPLVLAAQDTTELHFPHSRIPLVAAGLGPTSTEPHKRGMLAHATLALSPEGLPLGVLDLALWSRDPDEFGQRAQRKQRATLQKESQKWLHGVAAVEAALPAAQPVLVIQDREGDVFALLAQPRREATTLLLRAAQDRKVTWLAGDGSRQQGRLFSVVAHGSVFGALTVQVPRRKGQEEEQATLELRALQLEVRPPQSWRVAERPPAQLVTVIQALEVAPPAGQPPIRWVLVTTHAVATAADVVQMVGYYACRWRIERLHYVLKCGLDVEAAQHARRPALDQALALFYLVAWRLLWLTYLGRLAPTLPATTVFSAVELQILGHATRRPVSTLGAAVVALGVLGGYTPYRSALPPGAKVLWRGYRRLHDAQLGYGAAQAAHRT